MKVTYNNHKKEQSTDFPKLMRSIRPESKVIVLMVAYGEGVVVVPDGRLRCGDYSTDWEMTAFSNYHGTVTMEND